jgi:hypothetical protein
MNDQPDNHASEQLRDNITLEERLRRYYDARRASGQAADELRTRVAARLTAGDSSSRSPSRLSIPKEITMLPRRSDSSTFAAADTSRALRSSRRGGRASGIAAMFATVAVIALAALIFSSIRQIMPSHLGAPSHASGANTSGWTSWTPSLPVGTWAAVYLDASDRLHFVTPSGREIVGPVLPLAGLIASSPLEDASISPDGQRLAYVQAGDPNTGGKVAIFDFATGTLQVTGVIALQLAWSPDSTTIAAAGQLDTGTIWLVNAATGADHSITTRVNGSPGGLGRLLSWTDDAHLAAIVSAGAPQADTLHADTLSGGPHNLLGVIDVSSGQTRIITGLITPPDVYVSPDGAVALLASSIWSPKAELANLRTGDVTPLPAITAAFSGKLVYMDNTNYAQGGNYSVHFAWQPGTHTLALSLRASGVGMEGTSGAATQPAGAWLLNLDADTATQITRSTYPLAWSADGQTLLLCSLPPASAIPTAGAGVGPDLYTLSPVAASGKQRQLAGGMVAFLGIAA